MYDLLLFEYTILNRISTGHFNGSVFVTILARIFLQEKLAKSEFIGDIDHIVRCFDRTTKLRFRGSTEAQYVKFGSARDTDQLCNIRFGQLKING